MQTFTFGGSPRLRRLALLLPPLCLSWLAQAQQPAVLYSGSLSYATTGAADNRAVQFRFQATYSDPSSSPTQVPVGAVFPIAATLDFGDGTAPEPVRLTVLSNGAAAQPGSYFRGALTTAHTYATAGTYTATVRGCCRSDQSSYVFTAVVGAGAANDSPVASLLPVVLLPNAPLPNAQTSLDFPLVAGDPNSEELTYRLATPAEGGQRNSFVNPDRMSIDLFTGVLSFFPSGFPLTSFVVVVRVSDSRGSSVIVEQLVRLVQAVPANAAPVFTAPTPASNQTIVAVVGQPLTFTIRASDSDAGDLVTLDAPTLPPGAVLTPGLPGSGNPAEATFTWTPDGTSRLASAFIRARDGRGGISIFSPTFNILPEPLCDPAPTSPVARPDQFTAVCGPLTLTRDQLLANDTDPQGRPLQISQVGGSNNATVTSQPDGTISFSPTPGFVGTATFTYLLQLAGPALASPDNSHYYEFVSAPGTCWNEAKAAAAARTYQGLQGYLTTVTSAEEALFLRGRAAGNNYWLGASDAAVEGEWRWQTGPEAGQQFWQGGNSGDFGLPATGAPVLGRFNNWRRGEPNDFKNPFRPAGEDYASLFGESALWNDLDACGTGSNIAGYVVEYGGLEACTPVLYARGTVSVNVTASPPTGANAFVATTRSTPVVLTPAQLLRLAADRQGRPLQVAGVGTPSSGTIAANADGTYTYAPVPGFVGTATIPLVVQVAGPAFASATGHYYEFVSAPGTCWADARAAAAARSFEGMGGYLATITSAAETDFVRRRAAGNGWIGAADDAVEGEWRWKTGPEAGQLFWQGGATGTALAYSNWSPGQPDDFRNQFRPAGEDYAQLYSGSGLWNDLDACGTGSSAAGYVVEYGGLEACTPVLYTAGTIFVSITAPVTASPAPIPSQTTQKTAALPGALAGLEAAPNPSAGQFRLRMTAAQDGAAQLDLFDLQGRRVRSLYSGAVLAGQVRDVSVDASELATGVYLVRLQSGTNVQHLRVLIQK